MLKILKNSGFLVLGLLLAASPLVSIPVFCVAANVGVVAKILSSIGIFLGTELLATGSFAIQYLIDSKTGELDAIKNAKLTNEDYEQLEAIASMQKNKEASKFKTKTKKKGLLHKATKKMEASAFESTTDSNTQDLDL